MANKVKTIKAIAKRFRRTGTGKVMRRRANMRHIMSSKKSSRKRRLTGDLILHLTDLRRLRGVIP